MEGKVNGKQGESRWREVCGPPKNFVWRPLCFSDGFFLRPCLALPRPFHGNFLVVLWPVASSVAHASVGAGSPNHSVDFISSTKRYCDHASSFTNVRDDLCDLSKIKSNFHEIWHKWSVAYLCQMSLLTFERPRSKFKVKTAVLKILKL